MKGAHPWQRLDVYTFRLWGTKKETKLLRDQRQTMEFIVKGGLEGSGDPAHVPTAVGGQEERVKMLKAIRNGQRL